MVNMLVMPSIENCENDDSRLEAAHVEPEPVTQRELTIVKFGTDSVPNHETFLRVLGEVQALRTTLEQDVIIIWSMGVRKGMDLEGRSDYPVESEIMEKRRLSGIGWPAFIREVANELEEEPLSLQLTRQHFRDPTLRRGLHEIAAYTLEQGTLIIMNEDDALSSEEFKKTGVADFLDNDGLARRTAVDMMATRLIVVTDEPGIYDKNPKEHSDAEKFGTVQGGESLDVDTTGQGSDGGRGGMESKLEEIELARDGGVDVYVTDAQPGQIVAAVHPHNRFRGTVLKAHPTEPPPA